MFYELCKQSFPDIPDQTIAKMVSGIDVVLFRPESELGRLAGRAVELGVADAIKAAPSEDALRAALAASAPGQEWLADWKRSRPRGSTTPTATASTTITAHGSTTQGFRWHTCGTTSSDSKPARTSAARWQR